MAYLLLGSARITTRSAGSRSAITDRATCRSRRATRCRCTELPTVFATTSPTLGPTLIGVVASACVHHDVGLHRPHPLVDCGTEFRRPRHPVLRRKHRARSCVESRSQRAAALATPAGHDRPAGPGPHPQPKPMHPRTAPVVGLKGPLALGHGCHSSLRLATASDAQVWTRSPLVSSSSRSLAGAVSGTFRIAAVSPRSGDCSRVLTRFP